MGRTCDLFYTSIGFQKIEFIKATCKPNPTDLLFATFRTWALTLRSILIASNISWSGIDMTHAARKGLAKMDT